MHFAHATATDPPRVLIIAELGVNHDGHPPTALALVNAAADAGADAVKLQLFDPRNLLSNQARLAAYQAAAGAADPFTMLDRLRLPLEAVAAVGQAARDRGLAFIITPFSLPDVEVLPQLSVDAVKIASPDAVNLPLLESARSLRKPLLISTGTCDLGELRAAADAAGSTAGALLQCVSSYPAAEADAALGGIAALARTFFLPVGYSDHTPALDTGGLAVAAGACILEKHLTHNRGAPGPDHAASLDPPGFAQYVRHARRAALMLGPSTKRLLPSEHEVRAVSRQSLCAVRDLPPGHVLTAADLTLKRPGTGLPAAELSSILGRRLRRAVAANDLLQAADLDPPGHSP